MATTPADAVLEACGLCKAFPGVRAVESTKVRWLGHRLVADITIDVDPTATVDEGHQVATATHQRLTTRIAHVDDVNVHVHPYQPA